MDDKETSDFLGKILGIDVEAEKAKRKQLFIDYAHLLVTLNSEQFLLEVIKHFGENVEQAAILTVLIGRLEAVGGFGAELK